MARAFVAVGSNIDPEKNVRLAIRMLGVAVRVSAISTVYETEPLDRPDQPRFYNCVVEIDTEFAVGKLKSSALRGIEDRLGRVRTDDKYAPRTIDLDVLVFDDMPDATDTDVLTRPFLAVPLAELAPDLIVPGVEERAADIAARFGGHAMRALPDYTLTLRKEITYGS